MDKGLDIAGVHELLAWHAALSARPRQLARLSRSLSAHAASDLIQLRDLLAATAETGGLRPRVDLADRALAWCEGESRALLSYCDPRYPQRLRFIPTPPPLLYIDGDADVLNCPQFAIVGSRKATRGACELAGEIAAGLAARGNIVTSGMALGIDAAAHRGALGSGGRTVAVLGCGIDRVYPARHQRLAAEISANGALVSEFPPGAAPLAHHFPQRNRVIAGLSLGTLVVEAAARSGSISTAMHALEQGREVFAVPGNVHNPLTAGCHELLRQGARLTTGVNDILEELPQLEARGAIAARASAAPHDAQNSLDTGTKMLLEACPWEPCSVDDLVSISGLTVQEVSSMLLPLELAGLVELRANGTYVRIR